ncbi:antibiotic biosynthesis monooxygenase [Nonomuraea sp. NPDC049129]|uniref:antibiotic biosynthesis monooxygenase n=1 Tax=Nonomuraea sp. NPDC049129 TaxID=3155272 RepID=UPI0033D457FE
MKPGGGHSPDGQGATVVISSTVRQGRDNDYERWQEKTTEIARGFPGFEGTELYPPIAGEQNSWVVVFRFSSIGQLTAWLDSEVRRKLLDEVRPMLEEPASQEVLAGGTAVREAVTAVISHNVRPGREADFARWQEKVRKAQERFAGFMGTEEFEPVSGVQDRWVVLLRYDTREHLDEWLGSDSRAKLLEEGRDYFVDYDVRKVQSAFSGWFQFGREAGDGAPPSWKQAMTVLLVLYPTVMILNLTAVRGFAMAHLPGYLAMFLSNVLSVTVLTWLAMPLVNRVFAGWLVPGRTTSARANVVGVVVIALCYAVSIAVFGVIGG